MLPAERLRHGIQKQAEPLEHEAERDDGNARAQPGQIGPLVRRMVVELGNHGAIIERGPNFRELQILSPAHRNGPGAFGGELGEDGFESPIGVSHGLLTFCSLASPLDH